MLKAASEIERRCVSSLAVTWPLPEYMWAFVLRPEEWPTHFLLATFMGNIYVWLGKQKFFLSDGSFWRVCVCICVLSCVSMPLCVHEQLSIHCQVFALAASMLTGIIFSSQKTWRTRGIVRYIWVQTTALLLVSCMTWVESIKKFLALKKKKERNPDIYNKDESGVYGQCAK